MNQLSKDVKTHVIVTFNGAGHFITSEQNDKLVNIGLDDLFEVNDAGEKIKGSAIAEVMTVAKYYETYPKRMSHNYGQPPTPLPPDQPFVYKTIDQKMSERKSWLEAGLRGLKKAQAKFRAEGRPSPNCDLMIRDMEKRIANFKENPSLT